MSLWLANGISPTLSNARVDTGVVYASAMVRAFAVSLALAANARSQSVSSVSRWTRANCKDELFLIAWKFKAFQLTWSFALGSIESWRANSVSSTRIRSAQVLWDEFATANERIAGHVSRARADWSQAAKITVSTDPAGSVARILANSIITRWSRSRAIDVSVAFWSAFTKRRSDVSLWTLTNSSVVWYSSARSSLSALRASLLALPVVAVLLRSALAVTLAFVATTWQRGSSVRRQARAGGLSVDHLALRVGSTWAWPTEFLWNKTKRESLLGFKIHDVMGLDPTAMMQQKFAQHFPFKALHLQSKYENIWSQTARRRPNSFNSRSQ